MQNHMFETVQTFKTVDRLPMTDHQYLVWWSEHSSEHRCADLTTAGVDMTCERQGYLVRYQSGTDQEYYSCSPMEIMDAAIIPPPGSSSTRSDGVSNEKSDWMESVLAPIDPITTRSPLFQRLEGDSEVQRPTIQQESHPCATRKPVASSTAPAPIAKRCSATLAPR